MRAGAMLLQKFHSKCSPGTVWSAGWNDYFSKLLKVHSYEKD